MRAPAPCATVAVASVLPLSTTITSSTKSRGTPRTTPPMAASSFSAGITTDTNGLLADGSVFSATLETPAQAAVRAHGRRRVAHQPFAELLVRLSVPYLAQALLGRVAQCETAVAA